MEQAPADPRTPELPEQVEVRALERTYDCCAVEQVRGWLGGTALITTIHAEQCPAWSRTSSR
ncbi:hypothetical protein [Streptomyces sp. NPDC127197]|uniref:hypothetical protein n=1 Tax=Streptomyces sp. NPDC127197 TaxID=3345388 RepID=UPI00362CCBB6